MNIKKWGALVAAGALAESLALFGCSSGDQGTTTSSTSGNDAGYTLVNDGKLTCLLYTSANLGHRKNPR